MSAGSLTILADYEDDDTDAEDTANPESKAYGSHLRGTFTVSQDGRCPRCKTDSVLFVILDELFPTGDMPEILYTLIAKGKAVLWSSQDKQGCKAPPTFLCRGFCPPDPLGAGFNIDWSMNSLKDIFFSAKTTDTMDAAAEDHIRSQLGIYNEIDESENKEEDVQESVEVSNNNYEDNENDDDNEEEEDDDDDEIDEDELIKQMLAKEAMKSKEDINADSIQPSVSSEIAEVENSEQTSSETKTIYYTPSSTNTTANNDDDNDNSAPIIHSCQSSSDTNKNQQYPVSSDGTCPFCTSKNVQYIIVCSSDLQDRDLPYTLRELLKRDQAFKMAKGANNPPSFLCQNCQYGFNLDWSITNLELIFGIPKKPSKKQADTAYGVTPQIGYPPPRVPPMVPSANVPPPSLPPRGFPPPYPGIPPPAVPPPGLTPPGTFPQLPPRIPPPRIPPPYLHVPPRLTPPPAYPPRVPPPAHVPPGIPPPPGQASPWLPPHVPPRLPPTPPGQASPRYPIPGSSPHMPRIPPIPPRVPPPAGQYPRVPPRYPPPIDYQYGYQQQFRPPAGYPPVQAGYHGYPGYDHTNPYYPLQGPPMPPPPGQLPYQQPPYHQPAAGYPPMQPPGYHQPPAPGTQYYPPTRPPTSHSSSYHRTHYTTYPGHTSKSDTQRVTAKEKEHEDKEIDQVVDDQQSLEDSHRFEELLNQIDHSRGVTSSQGSGLDVDLSQNEPNSISEEHGDADYDERPPGDDYDDTTPEFETVPSAKKKQKSKVESKDPITNLEPSGDAMETTTMETQETSSSITEPKDSEEQDTAVPYQNQAEESEEAMEMTDESAAKDIDVKETVAKNIVSKKAPKGRRGRKRKTAEKPQEDSVTKQPKVTDESSQEDSEEVKLDSIDAVGEEQKLIEDSAKDENEEPLLEEESTPNPRRGKRKRATKESRPTTKGKMSESNKFRVETKGTEENVTKHPEVTDESSQKETEEVKLDSVDAVGEEQKLMEDSAKDENKEPLLEEESTPNARRGKRKRATKQSRPTIQDKVSESNEIREDRKDTVSYEMSSTEPSENEQPSEQEVGIQTAKSKARRSRKDEDKTDEVSQSSSVDAEVPPPTSTRQRRGRSRGGLPDKDTRTMTVTDDKADSVSPITITRKRRGRPQKDVDVKESEPNMKTAKFEQTIPGTPRNEDQKSDSSATGRGRGQPQRGNKAEAVITNQTDEVTSVETDTGTTGLNTTSDESQQLKMEVKDGIKKKKDNSETNPTDSQQSDVETPAANMAPVGRRKGRSMMVSSKEDDTTVTEPTDSQQSDVETPPANMPPVGRRKGQSLRGSSKKDDTDSQQSEEVEEPVGHMAATRRRTGKSPRGSFKKADTSTTPEDVSQALATTPLDVSASFDVDHHSKPFTSNKGRRKGNKQKRPDHDSSSPQVEEQSSEEEVVSKTPTRRRQSSNMSKDVDSDSTPQVEQSKHEEIIVGSKKTVKNKAKSTRKGTTLKNEHIGDTSADVETSDQEKSNVLSTKRLRKASLNKEESMKTSVTDDDAAVSDIIESPAGSPHEPKITPTKTSRRVLRKRN